MGTLKELELEDRKKELLKTNKPVEVVENAEPEDNETGGKDKNIRELQKKLKVIETSYKDLETMVKVILKIDYGQGNIENRCQGSY